MLTIAPIPQHKYEIYDKTIYFSCIFDEPMDQYYAIMKNRNRLIFVQNDQFKYSYLDNPINLTRNITEAIFANCYVRGPIVLSRKLILLTFDQLFNQLINLTKNITVLRVGMGYNQIIGLNKNIKNLVVGSRFNQPIVLNKKISRLSFGNSFNQPIVPTSNITHMIFGKNFNQPIDLIAPSVDFNCDNCVIIDNLPNTMVHITLGHIFNTCVNNVPNSVKKITVRDKLKCNHLIPGKFNV